VANVLHLIGVALQFYLIAFLLRIGLSWFPPPTGNFMVSVTRFLYAVTEPVLAPLRAILPPVRAGSRASVQSPTGGFLGGFILISFLGA
jgi:YggT family protein